MVTALKTPQSFQYDAASFLFRAHPLVAHSELSGCVVSVQDVTELKQNEKQLDMQSTMIAEINHRVKNTLQNVISLLNMQIRRTKEAKVKEAGKLRVEGKEYIVKDGDVMHFRFNV